MQLKYHLFKISFDILFHHSSEGYYETVEMIKKNIRLRKSVLLIIISNFFNFLFNDNDTHSHLCLQPFFKKKLIIFIEVNKYGQDNLK